MLLESVAKTPEGVKLAAGFMVLAALVIGAESAYRRRLHQERLATTDIRYSLQPSGDVCGGWITPLGELCLVLTRERLAQKRVNTIILLDGSLSRISWYWHCGGQASKYEKILKHFGPALAEYDTDSKVDVCIISLGPDGKGIYHLGAFSASEFGNIRIPDNLDFGQQTDIMYALSNMDEFLYYEGVNRYQAVLVTDGETAIQAIEQQGLNTMHAMTAHAAVARKVNFVVPARMEIPYTIIDTLPGSTVNDPDPFKVLVLRQLRDAPMLAKSLWSEPLFPQSIQQQWVAESLEIRAGRRVYRVRNVRGIVRLRLPARTKKFTVLLDGRRTQVTTCIP